MKKFTVNIDGTINTNVDTNSNFYKKLKKRYQTPNADKYLEENKDKYDMDMDGYFDN